MAPKKSKKVALSEFLGDTTLGSWADEMDALPSAPAPKENNDHLSKRDDFLASRPDRPQPVRDDVPLPTQPPYTAFVGNLAFDLTEGDLEQFFQNVKSVKIIKDRDDKPKGFGYVEFEDLDGLKVALTQTGQALSGRTLRVSVAEPPKERSFSHPVSPEDSSKFDNPWRREGPPPDAPHARESSRRKFEGAPEKAPSVSETTIDWRSSRPQRPTEPETASKRKGPEFFNGDNSAADKEETWAIGAKFKPSEEGPGSRFGSIRRKAEGSDPPAPGGDWRGTRPKSGTRGNVSPNSSTPPTPQMGRRKLDLLPRSDGASASPSPLSSPKMGPTPPTSRSNPFGTAKPVDVYAREKEIAERLEKDRDRLSMSRTNSRTGTERPSTRPRTPPSSVPVPSSPRVSSRALGPNVRPTLSFANVAANKEGSSETHVEGSLQNLDGAEKIAEEINDIQLQL